MAECTVIIGAGQAGIQAAASLRSGGYAGRIRVLSDEADPPYQKPPLSKGFLMGQQKEENLAFRAPDYYEANRIELELGKEVESIDTSAREVRTSDGGVIGYNHLVLATGARNRLLNIPGSDLEGICYLRNMAEGKALKSALATAGTIAVIGGGFIGLEIAAAAREAGAQVTVVEMLNRLMARVLPPVVSEVFEDVHRKKGVKLLLDTRVTAITGANGKADGVLLNDGSRVPADLVVVGIGIVPNQELAEQAGIACGNGIAVDEYMRTSAPDVYAIGDCTLHDNPFMGASLRLESVQNAMDQAKIAAAGILGIRQKYHYVPWFWTHQFELKLQMAGCNAGFSEYILRGDLDEHKFSVYYYKGDRLIGVDSMNRASDHLAARKLLQAGISPRPAEAADVNFNLKDLVDSAKPAT